MDMWNLHTKAHAFGHMGSMKIKSFFIPKVAQKRPKMTTTERKSKTPSRIDE